MDIASAWESYERKVLPTDLPPIIVERIRRAFYAGVILRCGKLSRTDLDSEIIDYLRYLMADCGEPS